VYPGYTPGAGSVTVTILPDARRTTGSSPQPGARRIVLVGCSLTQGCAISDDETYAWQLQQRFPAIEFMNYGTGGYSTYQSLLMLEHYFAAAANPPPLLVIYGMAGVHAARNVAPWWWLRALSRAAHRGHVRVPFCTLDRSGGLVRRAPEGYPHWPGRRALALVRFAEETYMRFKTRARSRRRDEVTERLLLEMHQLCARHSSALVVALLDGNRADKVRYLDFTRQHGIAALDCTHVKTRDLRVEGEGHPNGKLNRLWADRIAQAICGSIQDEDLMSGR
jgi:hypothetical protein